MGQTALHIGAIWGSVEAVKVLLEAKADPGAQNKLRGSTPMHAAAMGKGPADRRAECVKLMIEHKGDPKKPDMAGEIALDCCTDEVIRLALGAAPLILHQAVRAKQLIMLEEALERIRQRAAGDLTLETQDPVGETSLHAAVAIGWREGVESLLAVRADPSAANHQQRTPLHTAVLRGNHLMLRLLLEARADASLKDVDPEHDPRFSSTKFEERPYENRTALHYAAQLGNVIAISMLLEAHCDPNAVDSRNQTPLHLSLGLRAADAEIEAASGVRVTGLQKRPEWNGRLGSVIGECSAPPDGSAPRWPVFLEEAAEASGDGVLLKEENLQRLPDETLDLLISARADVNLGNQVTGETRTVLHEAARGGDAVLASKVLAAGARVNHQDAKTGFSALHLAARARHHELVRLLLEARADTAQRSDPGGKTAIELAETNGASAATIALLRGDEPPASDEAVVEAKPQTLADLTPEQRAMLFID